ncbi:DUF3099 domain-containing protein [Saccharopolyspora erythraea]|uniref:DUF3099 domain-containing protein n=1 Tax=Saccharopolyspora erythraea TaxID=1836 RepID=UPI001BA6DC96|nr:DUF3099 domain-containing protein [Saccharopolyspora erythraea]QUG99836.1 DUF3099 domain-containing protein [Saccharopolyspora erythraea]
MRHTRREVALITDAAPSLTEEQRGRKRTYSVFMVLHLAGLTLAALLVDVPWLALGILVLTGPLIWVATVLANSRPAPEGRRRAPPPRRALGG